jgi:hypothetical protein
MTRGFIAVIAGIAIVALFILATDQFFAFAIDGFDLLQVKPAYYYVISLASTVAWSTLGGWTCASVAKTGIRPLVRVMILLGELVGIARLAILWHTRPAYYLILPLVLYPLAVLFGASSFEWTRPLSKSELSPGASGNR